jgi:peptidoglycan/xylan/chitin deacetylase (PgdA/CDA1 family)
MNSYLKAAALALLGSAAALNHRIRTISKAGVLTILNLHRIAPDDGSAYRPIDPVIFDELLQFLAKHFEFVTFSELELNSKRLKPQLILSFDDGYRDFLEFAVPILRKHRVRANQNVIPKCIETGLPPLNVLAQDFIGMAPPELLDTLDVPGLDVRRFVQRRVSMALAVSAFIKNRPTLEQLELEAALIPQFQRFQEFTPTTMMSRREIQELASSHEIGVHSFGHATMAFETDEFFQDDLAKCRAYFQSQLNLPALIYAFPNGSYRSSQVSLARAAGVQHVLLVGNDFSHPSNATHSRFGIHAATRSEALYRSLGGLRKPIRA